MKKTAVVILNWNGKDLMEKFLPSVTGFSPQADIWVIDNASTDDSIKFLPENYPEIKMVQLDKNYGFAGGYNRGLKNINYEYLVLLNSDIEVTENWLEPLIFHLENNPKTAVLQPKIKDYKDKKMFEYAGAAGGYLDFFGYPYCDGRLLFTVEQDKGQYEKEKEIFWASGACFVIRKNVFDKFKGFDESYFAHQEEIDLCWRIKNHDYQIKYIPKSTVYHLGGASLDSQNPFKTYLNFRNSLLNLLKNLPTINLFPVIFSRLLLDGLAGIVFIFQGKPKHTWAVVKAHFGFYKRIPSAWKKRSKRTTKKYYHRFSVFLKFLD